MKRNFRKFLFIYMSMTSNQKTNTICIVLLFDQPYEPLVVLAVAVLDDVHQLEVGHVDLDQAEDDPLLGELQAGVPV
jgi:hypothetical protein